MCSQNPFKQLKLLTYLPMAGRRVLSFPSDQTINQPKKCSECSVSLTVDGGFSPWSEFGPCSKTCEKGFQRRFRTCTNPAPADGGKLCLEHFYQTRDCVTATTCPGDLRFEWGWAGVKGSMRREVFFFEGKKRE